jgi:uncharacterized membrane protein
LAVDSHTAHRFVQWVLRGGLILACVLVAVGVGLAFATGEHAAAAIRLQDVVSSGTVADRIIALGLLLLALTPVVRVISLVVIYALERDRKFATVALIVVTVLAAAIASGHG